MVLRVRKRFENYLNFVANIKQQQLVRNFSIKPEANLKVVKRDDILKMFQGKKETLNDFK